MSAAQPNAGTGSGLMTGLKITSAFLALGLLVQAWLGSSGFYNGNPDLVAMHEWLGNLFIVVAVVQVTLAFFAAPKEPATKGLLYVSGLTVIGAIAQIGLGYAGRENAGAMAWHLPNGVLLMGLCTMSLLQVWGPTTTRD
jgi:hypothetical protein